MHTSQAHVQGTCAKLCFEGTIGHISRNPCPKGCPVGGYQLPAQLDVRIPEILIHLYMLCIYTYKDITYEDILPDGLNRLQSCLN